ncbi:carbohydrate ABC transporter permease [Streptomyces marincola]|uniref:carbohydrate ABC transporter permease n=1 Tax=Streptomyces marincola TaxID=2878388 RepID=UPI001CF2CBFF|nr:sugar ABC transporter permease [Streptomyces marincola]UCM86584.1 sugar ABC transporter permease [Streptomyces marincola]
MTTEPQRTPRRGAAEPTGQRPPTASERPPGLRREHRRRSAFAYLTLSPTLAIVGLLMAYPLYVAIDLSLRGGQIADLLNLERNPLTLDNYGDVLGDPGLAGDIVRSIVYTLGVVIPAFAIGLGLAVLLNKAFPGRRIIRPLVLLPWAVPGVVVSAAFAWMFDASYGVVNYLLRTVGAIDSNVAWLVDSNTAMFAVILPTVWKYYPFFVLVLLAQLQSVPNELYEAARVDGASPLRQFTHVTWPAIRTAASLAIVITGIGVFREFDFIFPLTGGGPNEATQTLAIRIYNEAFQFFEMGTAAALGIVTMAICGVLLKAAGRAVRREFG